MDVLLLLLIAGLAVALWRERRRRRADWASVGHILDAVVEGRRPSSFILHGSDAYRRIGLHLETLADQRDRLQHQISQDGFNLQTILASMADGVVVVDPALQIRLANTAFQSAFNLRGTPQGRTILQALRNPEVERALREIVETGTPFARALGLPANGRHFFLNAAPVRNAEGAVLGVAAIFHDITRLKQLEQVRRDFVANVSHELRTPLSIFQGYLEMLLDTPDLAEERRTETLHILQRHSARLNALVEDLLTLARLEQRQGAFEPEPVDPAALLAAAELDWRHQYTEKEVHLRVEETDGLPLIRGELLRLEQVMNNLLENALKYTPAQGCVTLSTRLLPATTSQGGMVEISVADTGSGIPQSDLPHIFERFYRADKARSRHLGGTGLGLAIVKHIIMLHGGSVHAESCPGGTTVRFCLPIAEPESKTPATEGEASEGIAD